MIEFIATAIVWTFIVSLFVPVLYLIGSILLRLRDIHV